MSHRVLIVGDDPATERLVRSITRQDWMIEFALSAADALTRAKIRPYDLFVTALGSSKTVDLQFLRQLRRSRPHVKVVVAISSSTQAAVIESMRAHAFSCFSGAASLENLSEMIEQGLREPPTCSIERRRA